MVDEAGSLAMGRNISNALHNKPFKLEPGMHHMEDLLAPDIEESKH
jgi:hypothetical protein